MPLMAGNSEQIRKYKEELFGPTHADITRPLFSDYSFLKEHGLTEPEFKALDIHVQARMIVHNQIAALSDLRQRHLSNMKRNQEEAARQSKANANGKKN